jgi:hypothetical protein
MELLPETMSLAFEFYSYATIQKGFSCNRVDIQRTLSVIDEGSQAKGEEGLALEHDITTKG